VFEGTLKQRLERQTETAVAAEPVQLDLGRRRQRSPEEAIASIPSVNAASGNRANRRHICFVTETYPPEINGDALTLERLINGLIARGHAVSMIRPLQRGFDSSALDSSMTLVRGLPLPGYRGLQCGLPAGGLLKRLWRKQRRI
jgi:hypothetical protein